MDAAARTATTDDVGGLTDVLTRAFVDDPLMAWAFPDPAVRAARVEAVFGFLAREAYVPAGASTVLPGFDGGALWLPPDADLDDAFWAERGESFAAALDGDVERIGLIGGALSEHHPPDRHWYLLAIGVDPAAQGRGLGGVLLAHTLLAIDGRGEAAFLEATTLRSRALYERFGFSVVGEVRVEDSPPLWPMWREPSEGGSP
jgi:ribosomal protein S18 acetylase RimI-like enzyme